jgi:hypothetical protein
MYTGRTSLTDVTAFMVGYDQATTGTAGRG